MNKYRPYSVKKITIAFTILILNLLFNLTVHADESSLNIEKKKTLKEEKVILERKNAVKKAKKILLKQHPKLKQDQLRLTTIETTTTGYLNSRISSVTFMNIDAKRKVKEIVDFSSGINTRHKISFLMFDIFLVKLPTVTNITGSVEIFKDTYHGTKSEFDDFFR